MFYYLITFAPTWVKAQGIMESETATCPGRTFREDFSLADTQTAVTGWLYPVFLSDCVFSSGCYCSSSKPGCRLLFCLPPLPNVKKVFSATFFFADVVSISVVFMWLQYQELLITISFLFSFVSKAGARNPVEHPSFSVLRLSSLIAPPLPPCLILPYSVCCLSHHVQTKIGL